MLEAREMNMIMRENRVRLAAEFEAEYPEIVKVLEEKIEEGAKEGRDSVGFLLEGKLREIENKIEKYLTNKGYRASLDFSDWGSHGHEKPYIPPGFHQLVINF
jgi:L-serine deaminase